MRAVAVGLALIGACALAIAVEGGRWWSMPDVSVGPAWSSHCFGGPCESMDWVGGDGSWFRFSVASWAAGLIGAACLVGLASALASKRSGRLLAKMVIAAALAAIVAGAAFVMTFPHVPGMGVDRGVILYFGGVLLALAAAAATLRVPVKAGAV
jgi:hypothetical protein